MVRFEGKNIQRWQFVDLQRQLAEGIQIASQVYKLAVVGHSTLPLLWDYANNPLTNKSQ